MNESDYITKLCSISLDDIFEKHKLSVRTYNVCNAHGLSNLWLILSFWRQYKDFTTLRNAGQKTEKELLVVCQTCFSDSTIADYFKEKEEPPEDKLLMSFSDRHKAVINLWIKSRFGELTPRAANALSTHLNIIDFDSIIKAFFTDKSTIEKIKNIGKKTSLELIEYVNSIEEYANSIAQIDSELAEINFFIGNLSMFFDIPIEELQDYISKSKSCQFPLFAFLQQLIDKNKLLSENKTLILKHRFHYFTNNHVLTLDEIGTILNITRERVRQITFSIDKEIVEKLNILNHYKADILKFSDYRIDFSNDIVIIRSSHAVGINQLENTHFTPKFICKILSYLHSDSHILFGESLKYFENIYLIRRALINQFDFEACFDTIILQIDERLDEDCSFDFDGYLLPFLKAKNYESLAQIKNVCTNIISTEFTEGVEFDESENIVFKRNTVIKGYELAEKILEDQGEPMKIHDIHRIFIERHPEYVDKEIESLRSQIGKEKDIFIYFGRTSTYGLLKWEKEHQNVKGGTIRDIVEEYLKCFDTTKHILEITEYVMQYRPNTNSNSVNGNMQANRDRFTEIGFGFWGLPSKNYGTFDSKPIPKFFIRRISEFLKEYPASTELETVEMLATKHDLKNIQVKYFIQKSLEEGKLKRENEQIILC
jgi:hypothetical protein